MITKRKTSLPILVWNIMSVHLAENFLRDTIGNWNDRNFRSGVHRIRLDAARARNRSISGGGRVSVTIIDASALNTAARTHRAFWKYIAGVVAISGWIGI